MTTAEDVKRVLEAYQRENHPNGTCASAMFDVGAGLPPETLVILLPASPSTSSPSPSEPDRNS